MSRTLGLAILALTGLSACAMSEEKFTGRNAELACESYEECGYLDAFGGSIEECEAAVEALTEAWLAEPDCTYDPAAARKCLREFKDVDCEETTEDAEESACDLVCGDESAA